MTFRSGGDDDRLMVQVQVPTRYTKRRRYRKGPGKMRSRRTLGLPRGSRVVRVAVLVNEGSDFVDEVYATLSPGVSVEEGVLQLKDVFPPHHQSKVSTKYFDLVYFGEHVPRDEDIQKYAKKHRVRRASPRAVLCILRGVKDLPAKLDMQRFGVACLRRVTVDGESHLLAAWRLNREHHVITRPTFERWPNTWFVFGPCRR